MQRQDLELRAQERAKAERTRIIKLVGQDLYLARSRSMEPGAFFQLSVSPWGDIRCECPAFLFRRVCKHAAALKAKLARSRPANFPRGHR
jgi:SWIM zinc finger